MKKILFADDDELILKMIAFKLRQEGYSVAIAKDGNEAMECFNTEKPDIVLTDIMMPYKSGLEVTQLVKKSEPEIPVVILSSLGENGNTVKEAFDLGVSDFVSKPFNPKELMLRIRRLV
ncbi:response regulator transcription factor [Cecembia calidifontis]|jgi:DNA-binding response OmpR family regulator|uniref:Response regulator receiver domain-containing protein n=1 Tax=Cecembia calidifontis TaxID=1187080 RepID=A0A4Q7PCJ3_9BACT|nr:response regulator [Cecembia calidifontis]RZS98066.1 response regulator receiver domain-containing protein [Cecembia calidifontis]